MASNSRLKVSKSNAAQIQFNSCISYFKCLVTVSNIHRIILTSDTTGKVLLASTMLGITKNNLKY